MMMMMVEVVITCNCTLQCALRKCNSVETEISGIAHRGLGRHRPGVISLCREIDGANKKMTAWNCLMGWKFKPC